MTPDRRPEPGTQAAAIEDLLRDGSIARALVPIRRTPWNRSIDIARECSRLLALRLVREAAAGSSDPPVLVRALADVLDHMLGRIRDREASEPPEFGRSVFFAGALLLRRPRLLTVADMPPDATGSSMEADDLAHAELDELRGLIERKWRATRGDRRGQHLSGGSFRSNNERVVFGQLAYELACMEVAEHSKEAGDPPPVPAPREDAPGPPPVATQQSEEPGPVSTIPARVELVGRDDDVAAVTGLFASGHHAVLVHGPGGMGKSTLARAVAHEVIRNRQTFSALVQFHWISVKAVDPSDTRDRAWLMARVHRALGFVAGTGDDWMVKAEIDIKAVLARSPSFLVIDNFEDLQDPGVIEWLLDLPAGTRLLMTSRVGVDATLPITGYLLRRLHAEPRLTLTFQECERLGLPRPPDDQALRLAQATGGSPLAIRWTVGLCAEGYSIEHVLEVLEAGQGQELFDKIFADHWSSLTDQARDALCAMSLIGDTFSRLLVDSVAGSSTAATELIRRSLIEPWDESVHVRRFTLHPLTRSFARRHATSAEERAAALTHRCGAALTRYFDERKLLRRGRSEYLSLNDDVTSVMKVARASAPGVANGGDPVVAPSLIQLFEAVSVPLWTLGYWENRVVLAIQAGAAAETLAAWDAAARAWGTAAIVRFWQGNLAEADRLSRRALDVAKHSNDPLDRAVGERVLALLAARDGKVDSGVASLLEILDVLRGRADDGVADKVRFFADWPCPGGRGHHAGIIALLQETGITLINASRHGEALDPLEQSRQLALAIGDDEGLAITLSHMGRALLGSGDLDASVECFRDGLEIARTVGRRSTIGRCLLGVAEICSIAGDPTQGAVHAAEAVEVFARLGMRNEQDAAEMILAREHA